MFSESRTAWGKSCFEHVLSKAFVEHVRSSRCPQSGPEYPLHSLSPSLVLWSLAAGPACNTTRAVLRPSAGEWVSRLEPGPQSPAGAHAKLPGYPRDGRGWWGAWGPGSPSSLYSTPKQRWCGILSICVTVCSVCEEGTKTGGESWGYSPQGPQLGRQEAVSFSLYLKVTLILH